jgi:hypothetical protein
VSAESWIFVVGFRVFDVGLLVAWLVWFFHLRSESSDPPDDEGRDDEGGGPRLEPPEPRGGGGLGLMEPGRVGAGPRMRDHGRPVKKLPRRGAEPLRRPVRI